MKKHILIAVLAATFSASPALAALKVGDTAPDFTAQGSLGGKDVNFNLKSALKKGPVVVYFYPSAYTGGCDLQARTFAEEADKFTAAGASIVGVSGDTLDRLQKYSADPKFCAGKFTVTSDADTKVAKTYDLNVRQPGPGAKDNQGNPLTHAIIERHTYVVGKDGKILASMNSTADGISPVEHVEKSLAVVSKK
jgi:peroxiredoxin Q/BCP